MKKINKIIIPVAGLGTRMLPATKIIPKEMLPLDGKPIIQYIVMEAIKAGFSEIILVSSKDRIPLESHFEISPKLENVLKKTFRKSLLKEIKELSRLNVKILNVRQNVAKGLGHAILCAKSLISNEPFAVMLPDMVLDFNSKKNNLAIMKNNYERSGISSILLAKVKKSKVQNYGIAKVSKHKRNNLFFPIDDVIEKPTPDEAPSNLFVAGRYVLDNEIFKYLSEERPDSSGEIQLTGAISNFLKSKKELYGCLLDGKVYDCGSKLGYLIANLAFSLKDKDTKKEILKFIKK